ncbi:MAG: M28 family peptidase, partial [Acidobacteriota bacterium]
SYVQSDPPIPVLVARLEDMAPAGIATLADLADITRARMTWDTDIVSPGQSANIIARIPGADSSKATVLSAHLDSPNCPGALDNGSGSAALIEVARVLDRSHAVPPVDVYLVWFGCHEKGLFGSPTFAATHQELLDRTLGMIELDAMARPLNGLADPVNLESWSYSRLGDDTLPLPEFLGDQVSARGIDVLTWDFQYLLSDITGFVPYDVPNALLDNLDLESGDLIGPAHYTAHWHTPNDTIEHARAEADQYESLTRVLLSAALDTGTLQPNLRVTPAPSSRVVFVASHTESVHMAPFLCPDLGTIIAWQGMDLDLVPYGQAVTSDQLENAAMVVVLPVHDYPNELADVHLYDEAWTTAEISVLEAYVDGGGFVVLTNSASRLGPFARTREANEDAIDLNLLAQEFGIHFTGPVGGSEATVVTVHELVTGVDALTMVTDNAVGLMGPGGSGLTLATVNDDPVMVLVQHGTNGGEVLALGDLGMLVSQGGQPTNFTFWQNLVRFAASR